MVGEAVQQQVWMGLVEWAKVLVSLSAEAVVLQNVEDMALGLIAILMLV